VTTLALFRNLFRLRMLGRRALLENRDVDRLPRKLGDGLLPGKLGFGTDSGYAVWPDGVPPSGFDSPA
jgi:hypothetical protein